MSSALHGAEFQTVLLVSAECPRADHHYLFTQTGNFTLLSEFQQQRETKSCALTQPQNKHQLWLLLVCHIPQQTTMPIRSVDFRHTQLDGAAKQNECCIYCRARAPEQVLQNNSCNELLRTSSPPGSQSSPLLHWTRLAAAIQAVVTVAHSDWHLHSSSYSLVSIGSRVWA